MTFDADRSSKAQPPVPARRRSPVAVTSIAVGIVVIATIALANVWTELQWFRQVGFVDVYRTQWVARLVIFLVFGLIAGGAVALRSGPDVC